MIQNPASISPFDWTASGETRAQDSKPERLREVASQFESLLIAQMLSCMRQADGGGWLGSGEDQASSTMTEMAEQCVAQSIAASGGLGLAPIIVQGLSQQSSERGGSATAGISHRR